LSLVAVARQKLIAGVDAPDFRGHTYDWRRPVGTEPNTKGITAALEVSDLGNALAERWASDAHFVTYVVREGGSPVMRQPRVNKAGAAWLREQGFELGAEVLVADVDNPGHAPWTPALRAQLAELYRRAPSLATAGVYLTAHGFRVLQPLARAMPVEAFEVALRGWLMTLEADGVAIDWSCAEWARMYRLPRVRRDGRAHDGEQLLDRMRPIDPPAVRAVANATRGRGKPRRPNGVEAVRELPATWADRVAPLAAALAAGDFRGARHEVALAVAGALLGRRAPAEYVPALVAAATGAAGWDAAHHGKSAEDTVAKWAAGEKVKGARWLGETASAVLEAIDGVIDAGARRAAAEAAPVPTEPLEAVTARLEAAIGAATAGLVLVKARCGLGKTHAARRVAAARAQTPHRTEGDHVRAPLHSKTAISVPTTRLARQIAADLEADGVPVVRFFGVLSGGEGGVDACQFSDAGRPLAAGGQSIPVEFCEGRGKEPCDRKDTCSAYGGRIGPKDARVAVGPHGMLAELDGWAGKTGLLVIDEPQELLESEVLTIEQLAEARAYISRFEPRYAAAMAPALEAVHAWLESGARLDYVGPLASAPALAWGTRAELEQAMFDAVGTRDAVAGAKNAIEEGQRRSPPVKLAEMMVSRRYPGAAKRVGATSRVLAAVWRCLNVEGAVVRVEARGKRGSDELRPSLVCTWPAEQLEAALRRDGAVVVLDAGADLHQPVMAKVVGYEPALEVFAAPDGAPVERTLLRTSSATRAAWLPGHVHAERLARAVRAAVDWALEAEGGVGVITFLPVELALRAARGEDVSAAWAKSGMGTLDAARAALAPELARLGGRRLELGHYGAMRGLDAWKDLDALVTLGDPWRNLGEVQHEVDYLGLGGGWEARVEAQARAELEQAHGRLRTIHRTRPCRQLHVGAVVPGGWPSWVTKRPPEGRPENGRTMSVEELRDVVEALGGAVETVRRFAALGPDPDSSVHLSRRGLANYVAGVRHVPVGIALRLRSLVGGEDVPRDEVSTKALLEISPNSAFVHIATARQSCHDDASARLQEPTPNRAFVHTDPAHDAVAIANDASWDDDFDHDDGHGAEPAKAPPSSGTGPRTRRGNVDHSAVVAPWERPAKEHGGAE
jgi:hypothetical protein